MPFSKLMAGLLDSRLDDAIGRALNAWADEYEIAPLRWRIVQWDDAATIEGTPPALPEAESRALCDAWARLMVLTPLEEGERCRTWYLREGYWHIEVTLNPWPPRAD